MKFRPIVTILVVAMILALAGCQLGGHDKKSGKKASAPTTTTATTKATRSHKEGVPAEWKTIHYDKLKNTPKGYFGPGSPCIKSKLNVATCKNDLKTALKHDPMELSVWMVQFNLLPGQRDGMSPAQLEVLRKKYAAKLEDWHLRKQQQPRVAAVIDSLRNTKIVRLSGPYYSTYTDGNGNVKPIQKVMNPAKNIALTGTMPDGTNVMDKLDCNHQPVSKQPLTPVPPPVKAPTTPRQVCPYNPALPPMSPECLQPKIRSQLPSQNPKVPPTYKGPGCVPDPRDHTKCLPVGSHPGTPEQPVDSPTGCHGACSTTTTTRPTGSTTTTKPPTTTPVVNDPPGGPPPPPPPSG